jgi:hypothetical protein
MTIAQHANWHTFVSAAPTFGADVDTLDPFYDLADRAAPLVPPASESLSEFPLSREGPETITKEMSNGNRC